MKDLIEKLAEQAGMSVDKYGLATDAENGLEDGVDIYKFAKLLIKETRIKAIEEVRQALKLADWPIGSLVIVEKTCERLSEKEPDQRYTR